MFIVVTVRNEDEHETLKAVRASGCKRHSPCHAQAIWRGGEDQDRAGRLQMTQRYIKVSEDACRLVVG